MTTTIHNTEDSGMQTDDHKRVEIWQCDNGFILAWHDPHPKMNLGLPCPTLGPSSGVDVYVDIEAIKERLEAFLS